MLIFLSQSHDIKWLYILLTVTALLLGECWFKCCVFWVLWVVTVRVVGGGLWLWVILCCWWFFFILSRLAARVGLECPCVTAADVLSWLFNAAVVGGRCGVGCVVVEVCSVWLWHLLRVSEEGMIVGWCGGIGLVDGAADPCRVSISTISLVGWCMWGAVQWSAVECLVSADCVLSRICEEWCEPPAVWLRSVHGFSANGGPVAPWCLQ